MDETKKGFGWGKGCLSVIAILVGLMTLGAILGHDNGGGSSGQGAATAVEKKDADLNPQNASPSAETESINEDAGHQGLSATQNNAVRSAEQYLSMSGFSRKGLIQQLSSSAGDGFSVADASAAVDSLSVDWNENAVKSAKQYLDMSGFSCKGLIQQLSSSAGDKYTVAQATYGAHQAGAC